MIFFNSVELFCAAYEGKTIISIPTDTCRTVLCRTVPYCNVLYAPHCSILHHRVDSRRVAAGGRLERPHCAGGVGTRQVHRQD